MDARLWSAVATAAVLFSSLGASARTDNFIVSTASPGLPADFAAQVAKEAERLRRDLAMHWLGQELPRWPQPCPIVVYAGPRIPAEGATTYTPIPARPGQRPTVTDFHMEVRGTPQRVLDSVLPHEITHTVLATHFGQALPRWADEGACTTVEHPEERVRHETLLRQFLSTRRGIAMNVMFRMREYPPEMLTLYAQGYSVSRFLISQGGQQKFIKFLEDYFRMQSWTHSVREHYGYESLADLQEHWLNWVREGSPDEISVAHLASANRGDVALNGNSPIGVVADNSQVVPSNALAQQTPAPQRMGDGRMDNASGMVNRQSNLSVTPAAASIDDGWYARRRQQVMAREETNMSDIPLRR